MYYKKGGRCDVTWRLGIHTLGSLPGDLSLPPAPTQSPLLRRRVKSSQESMYVVWMCAVSLEDRELHVREAARKRLIT